MKNSDVNKYDGTIFMCMTGGRYQSKCKCKKCGKPTLIKYIDTDGVFTICPFCDDIPTRS